MMIKLSHSLIAALLLPAASARLNYPQHIQDVGRELLEKGCHDCSCFTCDSVADNGDGTLAVTVGHCKDDTISWMCCTAVDGVEGACSIAPGGCAGTQEGKKCNTVPSSGLVVTVPDDAVDFTINTHDGKTSGDADANNAQCGGKGNQGGSCAAPTAHCLITFKLSECGGKTVPPTVPPTAPTTTVPPTVPPKKSSASGDPHFTTWSEEKFDFHGGCDLVLMSNPGFADGAGIDVHIRTKIETWWSFIETAAIRIGDQTLQVAGGREQVPYWINGEEVADMETGDTMLGDYPVHFKKVNTQHRNVRIELGNGDAVSIDTFKRFVRVNFNVNNQERFAGSLGMLGAYPSGFKVGRDGKTVFENADEFGQEWQVLATEPKLFSTESPVQHPEKCLMPDVTKKAARRLGESLITEEQAAEACARVSESERDACIFDVLATNDSEMAGSY